MTVRLAVAVQHHPSRPLPDRLLAPLAAANHPLAIITDQPDQPPSAWRTYRMCVEWGAIQEDVSHVLIVQDDAEPCAELMRALPRAIKAQPDVIGVACVTGNARQNCRRMRLSMEAGHSWCRISTAGWCPTVATWYPIGVLQRMLTWAATPGCLPRRLIGDDPIVGAFCEWSGVPVLATVPSLVEHPDDQPSLFGGVHYAGRAPERRACVPLAGDALAIDWTRGPD